MTLDDKMGEAWPTSFEKLLDIIVDPTTDNQTVRNAASDLLILYRKAGGSSENRGRCWYREWEVKKQSFTPWQPGLLHAWGAEAAFIEDAEDGVCHDVNAENVCFAAIPPTAEENQSDETN